MYAAFNTILVAVDGHGGGQDAAALAEALASSEDVAIAHAAVQADLHGLVEAGARTCSPSTPVTTSVPRCASYGARSPWRPGATRRAGGPAGSGAGRAVGHPRPARHRLAAPLAGAEASCPATSPATSRTRHAARSWSCRTGE